MKRMLQGGTRKRRPSQRENDAFETLRLLRHPGKTRGHIRPYPKVTFAPASTLSGGKCDPTWSKCNPPAGCWAPFVSQASLITPKDAVQCSQGAACFSTNVKKYPRCSISSLELPRSTTWPSRRHMISSLGRTGTGRKSFPPKKASQNPDWRFTKLMPKKWKVSV